MGDKLGNVIRHLNQKLRGELAFEKTEKHFDGEETNYNRQRRDQADELTLLEQKISKALAEGNRTIAELECELRSDGFWDRHQRHCGRVWDGVLCWAPTPAGSTVFLPCPVEFNEIKYDTSENASKECFANGTWSAYTNYNLCQPIESSVFEVAFDANATALTSLLYSIGYSISLVALLVAMSIFLYFKDLRCLRNTIHTNLMFTYVMADFMWILTINLQSVLQKDTIVCILLTLALHYFYITTFFWMFVEGLYLYMLVVETFNRKSLKTHFYICVGWGIPVLVMIVWTTAKGMAPLHNDPIAADIFIIQTQCHWINASVYDWIFKVPILTVMALNSVFLVMIMWVLITKLRSTNNAETQQYRKAAKALMVLIPLLGITYILTIVSSTEGIVAQFFYNLRAFMLSSQGFLVALFYCFLNSEVQNTIRHRLESWSAARSLGGDRRYNYSKDWSPRSRTESIRLYSQPVITPYRKRESCASESTTTTMVNNNGSRVSNGSMASTVNSGTSAKATTPFLSVTPENNL